MDNADEKPKMCIEMVASGNNHPVAIELRQIEIRATKHDLETQAEERTFGHQDSRIIRHPNDDTHARMHTGRYHRRLFG